LILKRNTYSNLTIEEININITAYERTVKAYQEYLEKHGNYDYVHERINYLYNELSEYLIARELHIKNSLHRKNLIKG
jgi:hypothetical protein